MPAERSPDPPHGAYLQGVRRHAVLTDLDLRRGSRRVDRRLWAARVRQVGAGAHPDRVWKQPDCGPHHPARPGRDRRGRRPSATSAMCRSRSRSTRTSRCAPTSPIRSIWPGVPAAESREVVADAAAMLKIEEHLDKRPDQLSGGQKQRVAIARGIAKRTDFFVLDDPLAGLDFKLREQLVDDLRGLNARHRRQRSLHHLRCDRGDDARRRRWRCSPPARSSRSGVPEQLYRRAAIRGDDGAGRVSRRRTSCADRSSDGMTRLVLHHAALCVSRRRQRRPRRRRRPGRASGRSASISRTGIGSTAATGRALQVPGDGHAARGSRRRGYRLPRRRAECRLTMVDRDHYRGDDLDAAGDDLDLPAPPRALRRRDRRAASGTGRVVDLRLPAAQRPARSGRPWLKSASSS